MIQTPEARIPNAILMSEDSEPPGMTRNNETTSNQALRLYRDLADWYPLMTPVEDYAGEAAGNKPLAVPFERGSFGCSGREALLGLRPDAACGA